MVQTKGAKKYLVENQKMQNSGKALAGMTGRCKE
jgi:hypothetical protein